MDVIALIGRILFALIFLGSGTTGHIGQRKSMAQYASSQGVPAAEALVVLSGLQIAVGGLMVALGIWGDLGALLALPACLLVALAFAAVGMAAATYLRSWQDFDLVQLAVMPLFLFSTTFYPLSVYPGWLQTVVQWTPLYHAIELMRALTTGYVGWGALTHVAYFAVMVVVGVVVAARRLGKLLLT